MVQTWIRDDLFQRILVLLIARNGLDERHCRERAVRLQKISPLVGGVVVRDAERRLDVRNEEVLDAFEAADRVKHVMVPRCRSASAPASGRPKPRRAFPSRTRLRRPSRSPSPPERTEPASGRRKWR